LKLLFVDYDKYVGFTLEWSSGSYFCWQCSVPCHKELRHTARLHW